MERVIEAAALLREGEGATPEEKQWVARVRQEGCAACALRMALKAPEEVGPETGWSEQCNSEGIRILHRAEAGTNLHTLQVMRPQPSDVL